MIITPLIRAKRILKPMERFKAGFKENLPAYAHQIPLAPGEEMIGVYENHPGEIREVVGVTDKRILLEDAGQWTSIAYSAITAIESPMPAFVQDADAALIIRLGEENAVPLPIRGHYGKCFDLYEFSRFLMRVTQDIERNASLKQD